MLKTNTDKILCIGCSHASKTYATKSWPYWIGQFYKKDVEVMSSSAAGVQIGVDKLCLKLVSKTYDSIFFQVPNNIRLSIGMNSNGIKRNPEMSMPWERNGNTVGEEFLINLNPNNNVESMKKFFGKADEKIFEAFNKWYLKYFGDNTYETNVRLMHNIFLVQELCKVNNIPYYIFFWHDVPVKTDNSKLFNAWHDLIDWNRIVTGSVTGFLEHNKYKNKSIIPNEWSVDGYHMNDLGSRLVVDNFVIPGVQKIKQGAN